MIRIIFTETLIPIYQLAKVKLRKYRLFIYSTYTKVKVSVRHVGQALPTLNRTS